MTTDRMTEASRDLAALLGANGTEGGSAPRPPTPHERRLLTALSRAPKGAATPKELIAADPETFADTSVAGLHASAASLVRKGLVTRGRRNSASRLYRLTEKGRQA